MHPLLRAQEQKGNRAQQVHEGWPRLAEGVCVWRVYNPGIRPVGLVGHFVEQPDGEGFWLERREQLVRSVVQLLSGQDALTYARFLHTFGGLAAQNPAYVELASEVSLTGRKGIEKFRMNGLAPSWLRVGTSEHHEGGEACFRVVRHVLPWSALPTEERQPAPLSPVLRLDETIFPDGRYRCEATELPPAEVTYRRDALAPPAGGPAVVLESRHFLRGRPLRVGVIGAVVAPLRRGDGWG